MSSAVDILEQRVGAAAELIASLRARVKSLEREVETARAARSPQPAPRPEPPASSLIEELERLRAERAVVREGIRELLREIDRVSW